MLRYVVIAAAAAGVRGQFPCEVSGNTNIDCYQYGGVLLTALPNETQWGNHNVDLITGKLYLGRQEVSEIPAGGFDACPYTAATGLVLDHNVITRVGERAFATLTALEVLHLNYNAITWMAPTSLDGIIRLKRLFLNDNQLGKFDYGALAQMTGLAVLSLNSQTANGDVSCNGTDLFGGDLDGRISPDPTGIAAAVASCGATGSPCSNCAVGCPATDDGPLEGQCYNSTTTTAASPPPQSANGACNNIGGEDMCAEGSPGGDCIEPFTKICVSFIEGTNRCYDNTFDCVDYYSTTESTTTTTTTATTTETTTGVLPASPSPPSPSPPSPSPPTPAGNKGLSPAAVAGIVVGGILGPFLLGGIYAGLT